MLYLPRCDPPKKSTININDFHCAVDTLKGACSESPRSSKGSSSRANCSSARGTLWLRTSAKVLSSPRTHDHKINLGWFCGIGRAQDGRVYPEETVHSHSARRCFPVNVVALPPTQTGRLGTV